VLAETIMATVDDAAALAAVVVHEALGGIPAVAA
jgi:hypothetical protein